MKDLIWPIISVIMVFWCGFSAYRNYKLNRKIWMAMMMLCVVLYAVNLFLYWPVQWLPHINGYIYHPRYGRYPEQVPFIQGMTIYPRQSAIMEVPIIIHKDGSVTLEKDLEI